MIAISPVLSIFLGNAFYLKFFAKTELIRINSRLTPAELKPILFLQIYFDCFKCGIMKIEGHALRHPKLKCETFFAIY